MKKDNDWKTPSFFWHDSHSFDFAMRGFQRKLDPTKRIARPGPKQCSEKQCDDQQQERAAPRNTKSALLLDGHGVQEIKS
ncbi:MAG TPA: hypothetical protein VFM25_12890 [Verrucomicrobiae bacterium]|nr:hypothetical protein [Verrucomicrobiae bacterium]